MNLTYIGCGLGPVGNVHEHTNTTTGSQSQVKATLRLTVSQSVCLGVEPNLGLLTRDFFLPKVTVLSFWIALSDERSGLSCVSLCHCSLQ
jgi:hypothetical protein